MRMRERKLWERGAERNEEKSKRERACNTKIVDTQTFWRGRKRETLLASSFRSFCV